MERGGTELTPLELVDMLVTVFCFLKVWGKDLIIFMKLYYLLPLDDVVSLFLLFQDSADVAQTLLDDFRTAQGYTFLGEFLLRSC